MAHFRNHFPKKSSQGVQTLMLHSLGFVTGDPTIRIGYPFVFHPGVQVTVTEPGDAKWVYMMLPVPKGSLITEIKVAFHRAGIQNHISRIRLVAQREPVTAEVVHDDKIETDSSSISVARSSCHVVVSKSIMLKICMKFANTDDMIEFGSVEIDFVPDYQKNLVAEEEDKACRENTRIYKYNSKQSEKQPSLADLFFQKKRKKQFLINRKP